MFLVQVHPLAEHTAVQYQCYKLAWQTLAWSLLAAQILPWLTFFFCLTRMIALSLAFTFL